MNKATPTPPLTPTGAGALKAALNKDGQPAKRASTQGTENQREKNQWTKSQWDAAYSNQDAVAGSAQIIAGWQHRAAQFRDRRRLCALNIAYGTKNREKLDLFLPDTTPPKGLVIFIHGGYWMRFDKSYFSHLAAGAVHSGFAVAMPSYDLKPGPLMNVLAGQVAKAVSKACEHVGGPVYIAGHSAGAQLAAMLMTGAVSLSPMVKQRIQRVIGLSGVYDLSPLLNLSLNDTLQLSADEVKTQSPLRLAKTLPAAFIALAGKDELPEFLRQTQDFAQAWSTGLIFPENRDHFTIIDDLIAPESELMKILLNRA